MQSPHSDFSLTLIWFVCFRGLSRPFWWFIFWGFLGFWFLWLILLRMGRWLMFFGISIMVEGGVRRGCRFLLGWLQVCMLLSVKPLPLLPKKKFSCCTFYCFSFFYKADILFFLTGIDAASHMGKSKFVLCMGKKIKIKIKIQRGKIDWLFLGGGVGGFKAEEIENAAYIIPRSMIASVFVNGTLGIGMLIAILFCLGDLDSALATPTGFPFIEIFTQATYSRTGGTLMVRFGFFPFACSFWQKN